MNVDRNERGQFYKGMVGAHRKHGLTNTHFGKKFHNAKDRCNRPTNNKYGSYGGRGIKVLWPDLEAFRDDMYESYLIHVKEYGEKDTTLDRVDVNGNYCKENCRWATWKVQESNRTNNHILQFNGQKMPLHLWAEKLGVYPTTLYKRIKKGWPIEDVLSDKKWVRHA